MPAIRHSTILANGVRHHVAEAGPADGPVLLLLHGWPEFWATWEPVMARLDTTYRLIAPDFRGFGESENPTGDTPAPVRADQLADDMVALLDALGVPAAGVVGHDVGSFVMQSLALRHPGRVRGLFFLNCPTHGVGVRWREPSQIPEIWYQTFHQMPYAAKIVGASRAACEAHIGHFLRHWCYRKEAFTPVFDRWIDNFMRPGNLQGGFNWYIGARDGRLAIMSGTAPKPPMITVPTRVLWGRHDPILKSAWADVLDQYFTDLEVGFAEGSGHFVHYEEPDLAATEIDRFFGTRLGMKTT
ncbi:MAG: alpha/beta fold hydrolase [Hyphomicrobiaceae bacterium]